MSRPVLWCIERLGGAKHIVDEMTLVNGAPNPGIGPASATNGTMNADMGDVEKMKVKTDKGGKTKIKRKKEKDAAKL